MRAHIAGIGPVPASQHGCHMRWMPRMYRVRHAGQLASNMEESRMLFAVVPLLVARLVSAPCESSLPSNIDAGMLQSQVLGLLQRSPTFQEQCRRIAAVRVLRVT